MTLNPNPKPAPCQLDRQGQLTLDAADTSTTPCRSLEPQHRGVVAQALTLSTMTLNPNPKPAPCQLDRQGQLTLDAADTSTTPCRSLEPQHRGVAAQALTLSTMTLNPNPKPAPGQLDRQGQLTLDAADASTTPCRNLEPQHKGVVAQALALSAMTLNPNPKPAPCQLDRQGQLTLDAADTSTTPCRSLEPQHRGVVAQALTLSTMTLNPNPKPAPCQLDRQGQLTLDAADTSTTPCRSLEPQHRGVVAQALTLSTMTLNPNPKPAACQLDRQGQLTLDAADTSTTPCRSLEPQHRGVVAQAQTLSTITLNPNPKPAACQLDRQGQLTLDAADASTTPCRSVEPQHKGVVAQALTLSTMTLNPNPKPAPCQLDRQGQLTLDAADTSTTPCRSLEPQHRGVVAQALTLSTITLNPNPKPAACQLDRQGQLTLDAADASTTPCRSLEPQHRGVVAQALTLSAMTLNPNPKPAPCQLDRQGQLTLDAADVSTTPCRSLEPQHRGVVAQALTLSTMTLNPNPKPAPCQLDRQGQLTLDGVVAGFCN